VNKAKILPSLAYSAAALPNCPYGRAGDRTTGEEVMKRVSLIACFAAAVFGISAVVPAAAQAGEISQAVRAGKIETTAIAHAGTSVTAGRAVVLIDAPIADVMAVIQNYAGYKSFLPNFEDSRVLSQRGASALVYVKVSVMHGASNFWAEVKLRPKPDQGMTRVVEGTMTKGNVDHFEAIWEATPVDGNKTLVAFQILVDPSLPLPSSLVSGENQKSARKAVRALRELIAERQARIKK
jgi:ribosome-associated toxin RatA of RatAB toxin-antitoxin module